MIGEKGIVSFKLRYKKTIFESFWLAFNVYKIPFTSLSLLSLSLSFYSFSLSLLLFVFFLSLSLLLLFSLSPSLAYLMDVFVLVYLLEIRLV